MKASVASLLQFRLFCASQLGDCFELYFPYDARYYIPVSDSPLVLYVRNQCIGEECFDAALVASVRAIMKKRKLGMWREITLHFRRAEAEKRQNLFFRKLLRGGVRIMGRGAERLAPLHDGRRLVTGMRVCSIDDDDLSTIPLNQLSARFHRSKCTMVLRDT